MTLTKRGKFYWVDTASSTANAEGRGDHREDATAFRIGSNMKISRLITPALACAVLSGCLSMDKSDQALIQKRWDEVLDSWRGHTADEVIQQWGYPQRDRQAAGHHVMDWFAGGCNRTLAFDADARVVSGSEFGDYCPEFKNDIRYLNVRRKGS